MSETCLNQTLRCVSFTSCTMYTINIFFILIRILEDPNTYFYTNFTSLKFLDYWELKLILVIVASVLFLWDLLMCGNGPSQYSQWFIQLHINLWKLLCLIKICVLVMFFVVFREFYSNTQTESGYTLYVHGIVCLVNAAIHLGFVLIIVLLLHTSDASLNAETPNRTPNNQAQVWMVPLEWRRNGIGIGGRNRMLKNSTYMVTNQPITK